jgi:hypothetical protein
MENKLAEKELVTATREGVPSASACGCEWRRGRFEVCGVVVSGDVLVKMCDYHRQLAELPDDVKRQIYRSLVGKDRKIN